MSAGHTPGRWEAGGVRYQRDFRTFVNVENADGHFVACVSSDPMHPETIAANARLIAAAPDMYEALLPVSKLEMWTESAADNEVVLMTVGTVRKMRAAIALTKDTSDAE